MTQNVSRSVFDTFRHQNEDEIAIFLHYSAILLGGNLVDGLPRAPHTEAVGMLHGGLGPAPITRRASFLCSLE